MTKQELERQLIDAQDTITRLESLLAAAMRPALSEVDYLLVKLIEECSEVQHRLCKWLIFGGEETEVGQLHTNAQRAADEIRDMLYVIDLLMLRKALPDTQRSDEWLQMKRRKFETYTQLSRERGRLQQ